MAANGILTALALMNAALATAQSLGKVIAEAQQAGRDVTDKEIEQATARRKEAKTALEAEIERRKAAGE